MRPGCWNCTRKHLAQAHILMLESRQGYPLHKWLAIGHMAEASDEIYAFNKDISNSIRDHRKIYESDIHYIVPIMELIQEITDASRE